MLETVWDYARERLADSDEKSGVQSRHALFSLALAERAETELAGPKQTGWLDELDREHDNLRAALGCLTAASNVTNGWRLATGLWRFWSIRGYIHKGQEWLDRVLVASGSSPPILRAQALKAAGNLFFSGQAYDRAVGLHSACLALQQQLNDTRGIPKSLHNLATIARNRGDHEAAFALAEQARVGFQEVTDQEGMANALGNLAKIAAARGQFAAARALYEQSLAIWEDLGAPAGIADALAGFAWVSYREGAHDRAHALGRRVYCGVQRQAISQSLSCV